MPSAKRKLLLATAMTLALTAGARAYTSKDLVADCEGRAEQFCLGFIQGAENAHRNFVQALNGHSAFCFPEGTTLEQVELSLIRHLKSHPKEFDGPADGRDQVP